jgi:hypothetical protein
MDGLFSCELKACGSVLIPMGLEILFGFLRLC